MKKLIFSSLFIVLAGSLYATTPCPGPSCAYYASLPADQQQQYDGASCTAQQADGTVLCSTFTPMGGNFGSW